MSVLDVEKNVRSYFSTNEVRSMIKAFLNALEGGSYFFKPSRSAFQSYAESVYFCFRRRGGIPLAGIKTKKTKKTKTQKKNNGYVPRPSRMANIVSDGGDQTGGIVDIVQ